MTGRDILMAWMGRQEGASQGNRGRCPEPAGGLRFAFYGRTSTIEHQDPETSKAWQLEVAWEVIAGHGHIVRVFFDAGQSRRGAWRDRPAAAELLAALRDPDRGFDAIIVGEYERAFAGDQLPRLLALFRRYGVQVWLPEAGGRLEPDSAKHQALIDMLGAQSLREVARARHRAMASMRVQTLEGRFLGGRAPYGYRLVESGAHPRLADARRGRMTYRLEVDPETAPVVRWLFAERLTGRSVDSLVRDLNERGVPCPAAHDAERNTHRIRRRWTVETVTVILQNPRYTGWQVWNRQGVDHDHTTPSDRRRRRVVKRNPADRWVVSRQRAHTPLVSERDFVAVQRLRTRRATGSGEVREYLFAGVLRCGICDRRMESHWIHSRPGYRCRHGHTGPRTDDRPAILYLREDHLITRIGRALHLPAAASPRTVADRIRANQAVAVCHADKVDIKGQLTAFTWDSENHTGSFSALENDPVW
ncbi:recombinase family protein [Saccharothrix sp. NRRL B-16348]|uniref:recombinase family protein n=1 Tax=Saccharothrix sp. NRRL B-16348 TaxID=1415542 RepID=UPI000A520EFD|nr:recombinase family protein [Saccharothrix sp. NRRL B-16348]